MKKFIQFIYKLIPFKKELFSVLRIFWKPSESLYKHLHFKGVFNIKVNQNVSFKMNHYGFQLENEIFWSGLTEGWEKESMKIWIKLCQESSVVIDIGANTGVYALLAKAINQNSVVYAFEPVTRVFEKLKSNIELNRFDIVAIEKAISNSIGEAIIYDSDTPHTYSVAVNKNLAPQDSSVFESKILTTTLDAFIEEYQLSRIDLIKIDVETHEPEVLEGFQNYLQKFI